MKSTTALILFFYCLTFQLCAQNINTEIINNGKTTFLLGKIDKSGLQGGNYKAWFIKNYNAYKPNKTITNSITAGLKAYNILVLWEPGAVTARKKSQNYTKYLRLVIFLKSN